MARSNLRNMSAWRQFSLVRKGCLTEGPVERRAPPSYLPTFAHVGGRRTHKRNRGDDTVGTKRHN